MIRQRHFPEWLPIQLAFIQNTISEQRKTPQKTSRSWLVHLGQLSQVIEVPLSTLVIMETKSTGHLMKLHEKGEESVEELVCGLRRLGYFDKELPQLANSKRSKSKSKANVTGIPSTPKIHSSGKVRKARNGTRRSQRAQDGQNYTATSLDDHFVKAGHQEETSDDECVYDSPVEKDNEKAAGSEQAGVRGTWI
jgi:hypothetical protein